MKRAPSLGLVFQIVVTLISAGDTITDIVVLVQYAHDPTLKSEFVASCLIFGFTLMFQVFIGIFVEKQEKHNRYASDTRVNMLLSVLISVLQMRLVVEVYFLSQAYQKEQNRASMQVRDTTYDHLSRYQYHSQIRAALALMQSIFLSAPQFILQTFVVLKFGDPGFIQVTSIGIGLIALSGSLSIYSCKEDNITTAAVAGIYVVGQFTLRMFSIGFLAVTQGSYVNLFVGFILLAAIVWGTILGLGRKSESVAERAIVAAIISPMLTLFVIDTSGQDLHKGTARESFARPQMYPLLVWRVLEGIIAVTVATKVETSYTILTAEEMWALAGSSIIVLGIGWLALCYTIQYFEKAATQEVFDLSVPQRRTSTMQLEEKPRLDFEKVAA